MLHPDAVKKLVRAVEMGPEAPPLAERQKLLQELCAEAPEATAAIVHHLAAHIDRTNDGLHEARRNVEALHEENQRLTQPPWPMAVFGHSLADRQQVMVWYNGVRRVVTPAEDLDLETLGLGDDVFLNSDLNLLVGRAPWGNSCVGETAEYVRRIDERRIVLRSRDEEMVVETAAALRETALQEGDLIRWQRDIFLAVEKIDRSVTQRYFLDEVPDVRESAVGGQRRALEMIKAALLTVLVAPDIAAQYLLERRQSMLLVGPPGCGKTLMARVAASAIQRFSGRKCYFAVVKPAEWENPYVGVTQANIRAAFEAFKRMAEQGNDVVVFVDELESVGRTRGHVMGHHSDKSIAALLAELDGFVDRGRVAIIAATNRKDLIDPALLERLSDIEVHVPRPDFDAAKEIFRVHLSEELPFSPNGTAARETRNEIIDVALSRIYSPNGDNALSTVKFRDGSQRTISAGELMSGRLIEQICRLARQRAFLREVTRHERGIRVPDVEEAVADVIERLATTLSPQNVRSYLTNLPQDMDVVSVQPVERRVARPHRYLDQDDLNLNGSNPGV